MSDNIILDIKYRHLWASRHTQALEVEVILIQGQRGFAGGPAISELNTDALNALFYEIELSLRDMSILDQVLIDKKIIELTHHTQIKSLVSMACADAAAKASNEPLWQRLINTKSKPCLPIPETEIASSNVFSSVGILPVGAKTISEAAQWTCEISKISDLSFLRDPSPDLVMKTLTKSIQQIGLIPGIDVALTIQINRKNLGTKNAYMLAGYSGGMNTDEYCGVLVDWVENYPIASIENPFAENDIDGLTRLNWAIGKQIHIVESNMLSKPNVKQDEQLFEPQISIEHYNTIHLDIHQAGTLTELNSLIEAAQGLSSNFMISSMISLPEDTNYIHYAVAQGVERIKFPAITSSSSMNTWNTLLKLEEYNLPLANL